MKVRVHHVVDVDFEKILELVDLRGTKWAMRAHCANAVAELTREVMKDRTVPIEEFVRVLVAAGVADWKPSESEAAA